MTTRLETLKEQQKKLLEEIIITQQAIKEEIIKSDILNKIKNTKSKTQAKEEYESIDNFVMKTFSQFNCMYNISLTHYKEITNIAKSLYENWK